MTGKALKLIRKYYNFQQNDLASKLGISRSYLSELESGKKEVSLDLLRKYSEFFKLPVSSLMLFSENLDRKDSISERFRFVFVDKVSKLLKWVVEKESLNEGQETKEI